MEPLRRAMPPDPVISVGPSRPTDPNASVKRRVSLRQAIWEASQDMTLDEIRAYVESVLREIESDEP